MNAPGDYSDPNSRDVVNSFKYLFPALVAGGVQVRLPKKVHAVHYKDQGDVDILVPPSEHTVRLECKCLARSDGEIHTSAGQMERTTFWCITISGASPFLLYRRLYGAGPYDDGLALLNCQTAGNMKIMKSSSVRASITKANKPGGIKAALKKQGVVTQRGVVIKQPLRRSPSEIARSQQIRQFPVAIPVKVPVQGKSLLSLISTPVGGMGFKR